MLTLGTGPAQFHFASERHHVLVFLVASIAPARADVPDLIQTRLLRERATGLFEVGWTALVMVAWRHWKMFTVDVHSEFLTLAKIHAHRQ
jgi:hypothetical protein